MTGRSPDPEIAEPQAEPGAKAEPECETEYAPPEPTLLEEGAFHLAFLSQVLPALGSFKITRVGASYEPIVLSPAVTSALEAAVIASLAAIAAIASGTEERARCDD